MKTKLLSIAIALGFNALGSELSLTPLCVTPTLVITPASTNTICEGSSIILSVSGAASYTWDTGITTASISLTPTVTTNYTVTGTNGLGCTTTKTVTVVVNPKPVLNLSMSMSSPCAGANRSLSVSGANTYTWSTGQTGSNITVAPYVNTTYTVTGISTLGCVASVPFPVNVNTPAPIVTVTSATICAGSSATLTASGGNTYYWASSSSTSSNTIIVSPTVTSSYMVQGKNTTTGCWSAPVSATVEVSICTGINELVNIEMALYPNPSNGILNVSFSNNVINNYSIEFYDAFGKLMIKQNLLSEVNTVNIKHLNTGLYLYKIIDNTGIIKNGKIIKE